MTFDKQVKEAKAKMLEKRIFKDTIFIILGIIILTISIIVTIGNKNKKVNNKKSTAKITTVIKK